MSALVAEPLADFDVDLSAPVACEGPHLRMRLRGGEPVGLSCPGGSAVWRVKSTCPNLHRPFLLCITCLATLRSTLWRSRDWTCALHSVELVEPFYKAVRL